MNSMRVEEYLESDDSPINSNFNPYSSSYPDFPNARNSKQKSRRKSTLRDSQRDQRILFEKARVQAAEEDNKVENNSLNSPSSPEIEEKSKLGNTSERTQTQSKVSKMISDLTLHHNKRRANIVHYLAALNVEDAKSKFQKEIDDIKREYEYKIGMVSRERDEWQWKVEVILMKQHG